MFWLFVVVCLSSWLLFDAHYHGLIWQCWLFKPTISLFLILLAWQAPIFSAIRYLMLAGLCVSLIGDVLTMLISSQHLIYAVSVFFLSHLLYIIYFYSQTTLSFFWPLLLVALLLIGLLMIIFYARLNEVRWSVCALIIMTLLMVWLSGKMCFFHPTAPAISMFLGAMLLLISNIVWLRSNQRCRFQANSAVAAAYYFTGHFLILFSLYI